MEKRFEYSKPVENQYFVGREDEITRLSTNFMFLTNTIVVAPQGWGKTSLIMKAAKEASFKEPRLRFCHVDLSAVRDEERFLVLLAQSVLRAVSENIEPFLENVKRYFSRIEPKITFSGGSVKDICLDFDRSEVRNVRDVFIDLPDVVAKSAGLRLVVCIDDFHNIAMFPDCEDLLSRLQDSWNLHKEVGYCISGNGNAMMESFASTAKSFRMFGDRMDLGRITNADMVCYIRDRFADSGKYLDNEMAGLIIDLVKDNPFYVQQLAHLASMNTSVVCSREVIMDSFEAVVNSMHLVFSTLTSSLTSQQLCYLHAVLAGEKVISSSEVLHRYGISSATSASRSKAALLEKGIIHIYEGSACFSDPVYAFWLERRYFK